MAGRRWTEQELETLADMYGEYRVETIAKALGRTVSAVHVKAGLLHLGRDRPAGVLSLHELMGVLGLDSHGSVIRWIRDDLLIAKRKVTYGQSRRPEWWITEPDLIAFLRANAHLVDRDRVDLAYRQYLPERWITLVEAFRRGAAWPGLLESAVKAGLIPEARKRGNIGTRWAIPERLLPMLVTARRTRQTDAQHRRVLNMYRQAEGRGAIKRRITYMNAKARRLSDGGRSGKLEAAG